MSADPTPTGPWIPTDETFDARLALVRQRMNWNVKEAAAACALPAASWRDWEVNGRMPRDIIRVARRISGRTGCDIQWLIGLDDDEGDGRARRDSNPQPSDPKLADVITLPLNRAPKQRRLHQVSPEPVRYLPNCTVERLDDVDPDDLDLAG